MYQLEQKEANGLERDFAAAFPELRFVGDGKLWLNDAIGPMCPDFVHPTLNLAIELFGDWWHRDDNPNDPSARFRSIGWKCIVIWESEFREDLEMVKIGVAEFLSKGQDA